MNRLTAKQKAVLDYILESSAEAGFAPTIREIAAHFRISIGPVQKYIKILVQKGYLKQSAGLSRGLSAVNRASYVNVPILGRVAAGVPMETFENHHDYVSVEKGVLKSGEHFALKVKGDSMTGSGIFEGDTIVVKKQASAEDGDIVVALIDGETAVKKLRKKDKETYLESTNPAYAPIKGQYLIVLGKVIYLSRRLH